MATRINPPVFGNGKNYERFKQELLAWREITDLSREKQGIAVALTLPENDDSQIREKVFDQLTLDELKCIDGFNVLVNFLDDHLAKDDLTDSLEKFEDFDDFMRLDGQSINKFIAMFDSKYRKIEKKNMGLPAEILAFKLLRKANISKEEMLLVLTGMNYDNKKTLYEEAKKSLKKFKGCDNKSLTNKDTIKLEPAFIEANEEALLAAGYSKQWGGYQDYYRIDRGRSWKLGCPEKYNVIGNQAREFTREKKRLVKPINPMGPDGRLLTCKSCGSFRHLLAVCPDSWENLKRVHTVEEEHAVLFTRYDTNEIRNLGVDPRNCAVLDSACSSTVCGSIWMNSYIKSLHLTEREKVVQSEGQRLFKFGGGTCLKSQGEFKIPAIVAGKKVTITTDVVDSDIPLLLSRTAMKKAAIKMDLENDTAMIMGQKVALNISTSGHCCIPISKTAEVNVEHMFAANHENWNTQDKKIPKTSKIPYIKSNNKLLALQEPTNSELIETQSTEAYEGITTLQNKVRVSEQEFEHGDSIFYKMKGSESWFEQDKVDFGDRKEVFVRDGAVFGCTYQNRLQRVPVRLESRDVDVGENTGTDKAIAQSQMNDKIDQLFLPEKTTAMQFNADSQTVLKNLPMVRLVEDVQKEDCSKNALSTNWVISAESDQIKGCLDVLGLKEQFAIQRESLTIEKGIRRIFPTHVSTKNKIIKTTNNKSTVLQEINTDVNIKPKDDKEGVNKLCYRLFRLEDSTRMVHLCLKVNTLSQGYQIYYIHPEVFLLHKSKQLDSIMYCHVGYFLRAGIECLKRIMINESRYVCNTKSQTIHLERMQEQENYRQTIGQNNRVVHRRRPNMAINPVDLRIKLKQANVGELSKTVKAVKRLRDIRSTIVFPRHKSKNNCDEKVIVFSDAAKITQKCCLAEKHENKIKMVACLTIDTETLSLLEGITCGYYYRQDIEGILRLQRMLTANIDNKSVIEIVQSNRLNDDRRLWVAIVALSEPLLIKDEKEIRRSPSRPDCVTKQGAIAYNLPDVFHFGQCSE